MTIATALQDARSRIAALDFTAENERIAAIDQQLAEIEAAQQRGRDRREEVLQLLRPFNASPHLAAVPVLNEHDGRSIADALLAGADTSEAAEERLTREKLERERTALQDGFAELMQRQRDLQNEREQVKRNAAKRTFQALEPVCAAYEAEARAAAQTIVESYAALSAISRVSRSSHAGLDLTAAAMPGLRGGNRLVRSGGDMIEVPAKVLDIMEEIENKGAALARPIGTTVPPPSISRYT